MTENEISKISENVEDMQNNPILKPLVEYKKGCEIFEKEDERESQFLEEGMKEVNELIKLEIYDESTIARTYKGVVDIYKRMLWTYSKNVHLANEKIIDLKKIVERYYLTTKLHDEELSQLEKKHEKEIKDLKNHSQVVSKKESNLFSIPTR